MVCAAEDEVRLLVRDAWEVLELDAISARIWGLLARPRTTDELVHLLVREFDVTPAQCSTDLESMLEVLRQAGALRSR